MIVSYLLTHYYNHSSSHTSKYKGASEQLYQQKSTTRKSSAFTFGIICLKIGKYFSCSGSVRYLAAPNSPTSSHSLYKT